ncbi:MAG: hypothetical protein ACREP1_09865, partial [Rhodanobacteraceae bacterium]
MAQAGELTPDETQELKLEAEKTLSRWGVRRGAAAAVNGRGQPYDESLGASLRRELTPLLKDISRPGGEKYDAERERLETRRRQAAILAQVALFDGALSLSGEQRRTFCELLARPASDAWWRPTRVGPFVDAAGPGIEESLGVNLGSFVVPEIDMRALLRPAQWEAFVAPQRPATREFVMFQKAAAPRKAVVNRGSPLETLRRSLAVRLERLVDDVDLACGLGAPLRAKLTLAGKLDIERACDELPLPEKTPDGARRGVVMVPISPEAAASWPSLFEGDGSHYQKALRNGLGDEQKQKVRAALRDRRQFHWQALIETAVAGFERSAALSSAQCEALAAALCEATVEFDVQTTADWRVDGLRRFAQRTEENGGALFLDFQRPAIRQQATRLE